jgi:hypothetical protein
MPRAVAAASITAEAGTHAYACVSVDLHTGDIRVRCGNGSLCRATTDELSDIFPIYQSCGRCSISKSRSPLWKRERASFLTMPTAP